MKFKLNENLLEENEIERIMIGWGFRDENATDVYYTDYHNEEYKNPVIASFATPFEYRDFRLFQKMFEKNCPQWEVIPGNDHIDGTGYSTIIFVKRT